MAEITLQGNLIHTNADLPKPGQQAPNFLLTTANLANVSLDDYKGKRLVLNIFPSVDTPVCAASVRYFNQTASSLPNTLVLCISRDLPFAQARFCAAEGLDNVVILSEFHQNRFGQDYGVDIVDGPMAGLFARAVVVLDQDHKVIYTELVPEIAQEPDYEKALAALK